MAVSRKCATLETRQATSEDMSFLDEVCASIKEDNEVENVLRRSNRDDMHKSNIAPLIRQHFEKSAEVQAHNQYPERIFMLRKVPKLAEARQLQS